MTKNQQSKPQKKLRKKRQRYYYDEEQEKAVVEFLNTDDNEVRQRIYRKYLQHSFDKLVENIIRTYKLYRDKYTYEELHSDTLSHLALKLEKFDPEQGNKSFSYFGTICRNYLFNEMKKAHKTRNNNISYEEILPSLIDDDKMSYNMDDSEVDANDIIVKVAEMIEAEIENKENHLIEDDSKRGKNTLTQNEIIVGYALSDILRNWSNVFGDVSGQNKFNKNLFYLYLREHTLLTTKEIRNAMKRFKVLYKTFRLDYEENNENHDIYM